MIKRTIGIDLGHSDQVAQIFDDGKPVGKPIRFRLTPESLTSFVQTLGAMPSYGGPTFDPVHIASPKQHALQRLTKQRARYQDAICCSKRRLLDLIRWACPALEAVLPDLRTRLSLALLGHFLDPNAILDTRRSTLARFIGTNASGNHLHSGPFVDQLIDRLKMAARETLALHRDAIDFTELQFEVRHEGDQCIRLLDAEFCGLLPTRSASGGVERPGQQLTRNRQRSYQESAVPRRRTARRSDPQLAKWLTEMN